MLQRTIVDSGAVDKVERMIASQVKQARAALVDAPLSREAIEQLGELTATVTERVA